MIYKLCQKTKMGYNCKHAEGECGVAFDHTHPTGERRKPVAAEEQYKCPSYFADGEIIDCECGKCTVEKSSILDDKCFVCGISGRDGATMVFSKGNKTTCHSHQNRERYTVPGSYGCGSDCHVQKPYGFVPEAGCKVHDPVAVEGTETEEAWEKGWDTVSHDLLLNAQKYPSRILDAVLPLLLKQRDADKAFIREILQSIRADERKKIVEVVKGLKESYPTSNNGREPYDSHGYSHACKDVLAKISQV